MGRPTASRQSGRAVDMSSSDGENGTSAKTPPPSHSKSTPKRENKRQTTTHSFLSSTSESSTNRRNKSTQQEPTTPKRKRSSAANTPSKKKDQKDELKPTENLIKSFFDKAAQKQKDRPSATRSTPVPEPIILDEQEAVEDDISDTDDVGFEGPKLEKGLPIATGRKRKLDNLDGKSIANSSLPAGSQRFLRPSTGLTSTSSSPISGHKTGVDLRPWTERFAPINLEELAVHNKKIQDVRNWLGCVLQGTETKKLLILKGAAGSGKTTTIQLIAKDLGINLHEWRNTGLSSSAEEGYTSIAAQFEDFVARAGTFGALSLDGVKTEPPKQSQAGAPETRRDVILVEEFPNTFTRSSSTIQSFRSAVLHYLASNTPTHHAIFARQQEQTRNVTPIVMIISESLLTTSTAAADSFTAFRLLGAEILNHSGATVIDFNPIAPTYMTKALELVLRKESRKSGRRKAPGPAVLRHLSDLGDIRSAISSLEFLCLRGDDFDGWTGKITFSKPKGNAFNPVPSKVETESLEAITQRESTLGLFHAIGKVIYNKREEPKATDTPPPQPPSWLPQHKRPKPSEVNADTVLNELGIDIQTYVAALHENYVLSCQETTAEDTIDTINGCIDSLSDSDILCPDRFSWRGFQGIATDALRQDEISFYVSVLGLLFSLPHPVKRIAPPSALGVSGKPLGRGTAFQTLYPKSLQLWRRREEIEETIEKIINRMYSGESSANGRHNSSDRNAKAGGVETWAKGNKFSGSAPTHASPDLTLDDASSIAATEIMAIGMSSKLELLLETIPFAGVIRRRRRTSSRDPVLKDIEMVTRIQSSTAHADVEESEPEAEDTIDDVWSTDKPNDDSVATPKKSRLGIRLKDGADAVVVQDKGQPMVLSDDDIEDD